MEPRDIQQNLREMMVLEMVKEGKAPGVRVGAGMLEVAPSTVWHRKAGRRTRKSVDESKQLLSVQEEITVVDRCYQLQSWGFPVHVYKVKLLAEAIVRRRVPNTELGRGWLNGFYRRHKEVQTRYSNAIDYVRACKGNNFLIVKTFFGMYYEAIKIYEIEEENIYNMDEIGFMMGMINFEKVIEIVRHPRNETGKFWYNQDGNREMVTVMECICANGTMLPPTIVYKSVGGVDKAWVAKEPWELPGALYGSSPNGWTSNQIGLEWLKRNFGPGSPSALKAANKRRLLLLDGHISHVNGNFLHYCLDHNIVLTCLPPHTTHKLQALDKGVFGPYKRAYSTVLKDKFEAKDRGIGKYNFASVLSAARERAFTPENIKSAFRSTGIWPPNRGKILREIEQHTKSRGREIPCTPGDTPLSSTFTHPASSILPVPIAFLNQHQQVELRQLARLQEAVPLQPQPQTAGKRILDLDFEEIEALPVPTNPAELRRRRDGIFQSMREVGVDDRTFKIQLEVRKIALSAEKIMLDMAEAERRIEELELEIRTLKEPNRAPRRNGPVPEAGFVLGSRDDFDRIAGEKQRQKLVEKREKVERTRASVSSLEIRIAELVRKKENARELEEKGRLPKRWKSSNSLTEDETTLFVRLNSVKGDLQKLEGELAEDEEMATASGLLDLVENESLLEGGDPGALGG